MKLLPHRGSGEPSGRSASASMGIGSTTFGTLALWGGGQTNLQETNALVWVMLGISVAGAIVTFGFLVYSVWKWKDRETSKRPYG